MEFQFGTNWAQYSRYVGDIFGAPLAAEGLFAFFLESTFLGVLLFAKNKISKKAYWISSLMVALGTVLSAFWIIVANSWQQTPAGFKEVEGRVELTNFFEAVFNPSTLPRFFHTLDAALMVGAFFVLGISAYYLRKGKHREFATRSLKISLWAAATTSLLVVMIGHWHAVQVTNTQPVKLAAFEGLFETQKPAPYVLFGIPNREAGKLDYAIEIPWLLSLAIDGTLDREVKGLNDFPKENWPPLKITFFSFHLMALIGIFLIAISFFGLFLLHKGMLFGEANKLNTLFYKAAFLCIPLPFIANQLGWTAAEVGRQPWVVYNLLKTKDATSISVSSSEIITSIVIFTLVYILLFTVWIFLIKHKIDLQVSDPIIITDGPFKDFDGKISGVDEEKGKIKVLVSMFGRETPVELDFLQIKKI